MNVFLFQGEVGEGEVGVGSCLKLGNPSSDQVLASTVKLYFTMKFCIFLFADIWIHLKLYSSILIS